MVLARLEIVAQVGSQKERLELFDHSRPLRGNFERIEGFAQEEPLDRHPVLGQRTGLVSTNHRGRTQGFDRREIADQHVAFGQALSRQHQC